MELVARNRFTGCTLVPSALATTAGILPLFSSTDVDAAARVIQGFRPPQEIGLIYFT